MKSYFFFVYHLWFGCSCTPFIDLRHGCLSPRRFYHSLTNLYSSVKKFKEPTESLRNQLLLREYSYLTSFTTDNFGKMIGNPRARQIPWDAPSIVEEEDLLKKWETAQTGYPIIDAIMSELNSTGWIHHLARDAVARFLTRGAFCFIFHYLLVVVCIQMLT